MELREHLGAAEAVKPWETRSCDSRTLAGGSNAMNLRDRYLLEVEAAESQLANLFPGCEWEGRLHGARS